MERGWRVRNGPIINLMGDLVLLVALVVVSTILGTRISHVERKVDHVELRACERDNDLRREFGREDHECP